MGEWEGAGEGVECGCVGGEECEEGGRKVTAVAEGSSPHD